MPQLQQLSKGEYLESISFKEEREQGVIESTVKVDLAKKMSTAFLPFMLDPEEKLAPNYEEARAVYNQQVKKLSKHPEKKSAVIKAEKKLQDNGHVEWVDNLTNEQKQLLEVGIQHSYLGGTLRMRTVSLLLSDLCLMAVQLLSLDIA